MSDVYETDLAISVKFLLRNEGKFRLSFLCVMHGIFFQTFENMKQ